MDVLTGHCRRDTLRPSPRAPSPPSSGKAVRLTMEYLQKKHRRGNAAQCCDLGLGPQLGARDQGIGRSGGRSPSSATTTGETRRFAGYEMEALFRNTDSTSLTTMHPEAGPTYVSPDGTSRTLDHWVGSVGLHQFVEVCRVLWQVGRRLQIIPAGSPRDHLPILLQVPQPQLLLSGDW